MFYLNMALLRDKDVAETGIIYISYLQNSSDFDFETCKVFYEMASVLPMRTGGGHICACPDSSIRGMVAGIQVLSSNDRHRLRAHFDSIDENHFKLQTYGIPAHDSPMKSDGTWSTEWDMQWVENLRLHEEQFKQNTGPVPELYFDPSEV